MGFSCSEAISQLILKKVKVEQVKGQLMQATATEEGLWCPHVLGADSLENP